jgi:uncharacterized protein (DUF2141 family)
MNSLTSFTRSILPLLVLILVPSLVSAADIKVRIVGLEAGGGEVWAALFANAEAYAADDRSQGHAVSAEGGSVEVVFTDLAPGTYGISVFQDVNSNEKIDTNFLGIPKERYGFSNNARGSFGPPDFEQFSFVVGDESIVLEIEIR